MKSGTFVLALVFLGSAGMRGEAAPHGGGHKASPPHTPHVSTPHVSAPSSQHFNPPAAAHSSGMNQGVYNPGYMPRFNPSHHSSTNGNKAGNSKTKLHNLSNALQEQSHAHSKTSQTAPQTAVVGAQSQTSSAQSGSLTASAVSERSGGAGSEKVATTGAASLATPNSQSPITGILTLNTGSTAATGRSIGSNSFFSSTTTGPKPTVVAGTPAATTPTAASSPSVASSATNPHGLAIVPGAASMALTSHLSSGYGNSTAAGGLTSSHRYYSNGYGSRSNGNRYGNSNNSMYFAQMRRLSQLVNALNSLNRGSATNGNNLTRVRGALIGVVMNNGQPPYQAVNQLSTDLVAHLPSRATPMMNTGQLARDLMVAMNGSGQNMSQLQRAMSSAHSILSTSGVNPQGVQKIGTDMMMVASWGNMANPVALIP
jgi:hypothetical protein